MSILASFVALRKLTASDLNNAINNAATKYVQKAGNTQRPSTTTFSSDPDLTLTLPASSVTLVKFHVAYATLNTAGFKTQWSVPADATGNRSVIGAASGATDTNADGINFRVGIHNFTTSVAYGNRNSISSELWCEESSLVATTTGGTCALQWAQTSSIASNTTVFVDSWYSWVQVA